GRRKVFLEIQSVTIMRWSREERAFAVEAYFFNHQSVIATQRSFRTHFNVAPRGPVPDRKSIIALYNTTNVLREHFPGRLISRRGDLEWPA
ncbi:Transposable element Tc3 transposase, partial [Caligus rogercresseyi]